MSELIRIGEILPNTMGKIKRRMDRRRRREARVKRRSEGGVKMPLVGVAARAGEKAKNGPEKPKNEAFREE